jgi:drug/metabolite transporter, DME family
MAPAPLACAAVLGARLLTLAAALLFSTGGAAIKATELTSWQVVCLRAAIAAVLLVVAIPDARRGFGLRAFAVGLAYGGTTTLFVIGNKLTTAAATIFLQSSAPLWVLLLSPWLLRERISRRDLVSLAVMGLGLSLFFVGGRAPDRLAPDPLLGNVLAACSGVAWAFTLLGLRWLERDESTPGAGMAAVVCGNLIAFAVTAPFAWPFEASRTQDWLTVAYLGAIQMGLAYVLLTRDARRVPAIELSLLLLIEPVLSPVWAWALHRESPGGWAIAGGALILGATASRTLGSKRVVDSQAR